MSRRRRLGDGTGALGAKRRRPELPGEEPRADGSPAAVEAALGAVAALFPRRLFGDALPPLVLRHQLYDLVRDRTAVDRHLNRLRDEGRVRFLHLGLGPDALGVVSLELYRGEGAGGRGRDPPGGARPAVPGRGRGRDPRAEPGAAADERARVWGPGCDGSGGRGAPDRARRRELVAGGAGSRALRAGSAARPAGAAGAGPALPAPRGSPAGAAGGKTPPGAGLGVPFLLHDLLGEERLLSVPTAAGPLLRLADS